MTRNPHGAAKARNAGKMRFLATREAPPPRGPSAVTNSGAILSAERAANATATSRGLSVSQRSTSSLFEKSSAGLFSDGGIGRGGVSCASIRLDLVFPSDAACCKIVIPLKRR